jgi:streptogramin lyase
VADGLNNRVLIYPAPITTGESATVVIGQPNFSSTVQAATSTGFNFPSSAIGDPQGNLWASDWGNNRVLQFKPPFANGMSAGLVLGQVTFTTSAVDQMPNSIAEPRGLAFDAAGNLWVADSGNSRVMEFTPPFTDGMSASLIMGKTPNRGTNTCGSPASGLVPGLRFDWKSVGFR